MSTNQNGNTSPGKDPEARTQETPRESASPEEVLQGGITGGSDCI